jgi:branched-chain amino acid transport system ATP-binding protein
MDQPMNLPMNDTILDVQGLVGGYGKMTILNGTSFSVPAGSITTLIGPNGAGKSTVFKAIFGLLKLREGRILFNGRDVTGLTQRQLLAAGICYVPQGRNIFPELSVRHNIELGAAAAGRDITDLAGRIEAALDRFPVLRRKATQQASTLSGGEQKQLEIVRGLLLNPQLLLIDEPSIGLSPLMVQQTFAILKELRDRGVSILMIEQNARSALEISDFGIVLELGQTRLVDRAERVLNDPRIGQLFLGGAMSAANSEWRIASDREIFCYSLFATHHSPFSSR